MKRYLTLTAAGAMAAAGIGYWMSTTATGPAEALVPAAHAAETETENAPAPAPAEIVEMSLGNPDAKVEVIEYGSFTCGHCANFEKTVFPELKENYIDSGKIHFIFRDVYFDRYGLWASMVARCDPLRYWGIQSLVFEDISGWAGGEPAEVADNLRKIGRKAGLSDETVNACLQDAGKAQSLVDWYEANAKEHGIDSTPSFIVNGEKYSNMSYEEFSKLLDDALAE
ncbi:DsbA family protein [Tropicimonas isoalkanivorans]|uniref:Protein-disulfide isomerase n=1 Tax=Tropicimonas isoalkanivorans TaxID=441112 RepID=A0A1I1KXR5_9RHOB|nr:DsbA family protein [Tropicimonas isoalkanivorans]SFC65072.1 Protein-disulfide isomerase [Tropicimonas isoalkanivorans]